MLKMSGMCVVGGGGVRGDRCRPECEGQIYGLHQPGGGRSHAVCVTRYEVVAHAEQQPDDDVALAMRCISAGVCTCVSP